MTRVYNFSAGPAVLPEEVLKEAAAEMLDYQGSGQSVMEMSHRSKVYDNIIKEAEKDFRVPEKGLYPCDPGYGHCLPAIFHKEIYRAYSAEGYL